MGGGTKKQNWEYQGTGVGRQRNRTVGDWSTGRCDFTIDVDRAISRASIDEALCCCVYGREVGPDEGGQNPMAPVGHQAVVLWVPYVMCPCWIFLPPIVPATDTLTFTSHKTSVAYIIHAFLMRMCLPVESGAYSPDQSATA